MSTENTGTEHGQRLKPKRNNTWIYVAVIALLLALNVFLFLGSKKTLTQPPMRHKETAAAKPSPPADTEMAGLQSEYNASLARLDALAGKDAALDKMLRQKGTALLATKKRLQELLAKSNATQVELNEARQLIQMLNARIGGYEKQIAELKKENVRLKAARDSAVDANVTLHHQVDIAKILHASNIRLKGIRLTIIGRKEKETEKAKRVDLLRVLFDVDENRLTEPGEKELHICIINPDNELLSNAALGSGSFVTADGQNRYYTLVQKVDFRQNEPVKDVTADWQQTSDYKTGTYTVEIYYEGYLIGKSSVNFR
ncbi:MAG: hypothetical protein QM642_03960 [Edaphocola sp.]